MLGKIGAKLGREKFTQLIYPDESTAEAYADLLSAFDEPQLNDWLSILDASKKDRMMEKIHESMAMVYTPSPIERLTTFLRNLEKSSVNELFKSLSKLGKDAGTERLEHVLNDWLMKNASLDIAKDIRQEARKLGLSIAETNAEDMMFPATLNDETEHPQEDTPPVTYEDLPDDPTGQILAELEASLSASAQNPAHDFRSRLAEHREQRPGDAASYGPGGP